MALTLRTVKGSALTHAELDANFTELEASAAEIQWPNRVLVTQDNVATTLGGTIDSTVEYIVTGIIDMTGVVIEVPTTGIYLRGYNFDVSGLVSSEAGATLFHSNASGNLLMGDFHIEMSGTGSKVYDLISNTGFDAVEITRINYNNCTSLGVLDNFRQGLETGTGRFGGTPELTLKGTWVGGFYIDTSITRGIAAGSYSLFKAGALFSMNSRFRSNMNVDLPAGVSFCDFAPTNFPNPGTVQMEGKIVTRAGAFALDDALFFPNITQADVASSWLGNTGIRNTHVGMVNTVSVETTTPISVAGTAVRVNQPTWTASFQEHFEAQSAELDGAKHIGATPIAFRVYADFVIEGGSNDELRLELWKHDAAGVSDALVWSAVRTVNNLQGGRDVALLNAETTVDLLNGDYVYWKIANVTDTTDVTFELGSQYSVSER